VAEAKRRRAAAAAYAAAVRASNRHRRRRRIAAGLDRLDAPADSSGSSPSRRSPFRCLRWACGLVLRFGLVALLALLITAGAMLIDSDQTAALRTRGRSSVASAVAWGKGPGARGLDQLGVAYRSAVERIPPNWIAASWHSRSTASAATESIETAGRGSGAGSGGIELSWRQLHSVNTSPATRVTGDSAPKSR